MNKGAIFSEDNKHRHALWRSWDESKPSVMFIGLNPSTANAEKDDPTINKVITFAKRWGYGKVYMLNLFTQVTAHPEELTYDDDYDYKMGLQLYARVCDEIIFAWGNFKQAESRASEVIKLFPGASALLLNKNGSPRHPLFVRGDVERVKYNVE